MSSEEIGHDAARRAVAAAAAQGRLPPALLITGEPGLGKRAFAEWIARLRWCTGDPSPCGSCPPCRKVSTGNHPDLEIVERDPPAARDPEGLGSRHEITVAQIREGALAALTRRAFEGGGRTVLVDGAESMNEEAQNALLKILEEPPPGSLLLLVTSREDALLPTVRSRCQELRLQPLREEEVARLLPDADPALVRLARGRPGWLRDLQRLPVQRLVAALDGVLEGELSGSAFARAARLALEEAPAAGDESLARRLALQLLHARLRDRVCTEVGGDPAELLLPDAERRASATPPAVWRRAERALLEAEDDLARHVPAEVSWAALGDELAVTRLGVALESGR